MQYLRKLNIFQVYRRLPCIIYKQTYLIPQQPFPTLSAKSGKEITSDPTKASVGRMQKAGKEDAAYLQQMQEYRNKYILPSSQVKKTTSIAIRSFLQEHGQQTTPLYDNKLIKTLIIGQVSKVFKSLPQQVRDPYEKRAEVIENQMKKQKEVYEAKHKIPQLTKWTNIQYYKFQMKQLLKKKSFPKFSSLSKKEQKPFIKECQLINKQSKEILVNFLTTHSLSLEEFAAITQVCEATERCVVLLKKVKEIQKKKIDYFSMITEKDAESPNFDKYRVVQKQLKEKLNLLEGLSESKLHVLAKMIGVKIESQQKESNSASIQTKVEEKDLSEGIKNNEKKVEQKIIEKQEIKIQAVQKKQETKAQISSPTQQKVQLKKPETQSTIVQEKQEVKPQLSSKNEKIVQTNETFDFSNQTNIPNEYSDILSDLKDENLDNLNILDEDYEVLKLNEMMEKARKLNFNVKNVKS